MPNMRWPWKRFIAAASVLGCFFSSAARAGTESRHELSPQVVLYSGDALRSFTAGGFTYAFHATRKIWAGIDFMGGALSVDRSGGTRLSPGDRFFGLDGAVYFNIPALLGADPDGKSGFPADLYTSVGLGNFWLGPEKEMYGFLGGGMLLHTGWKRLAFRFDLKGIFYRLANGAGQDFNSDMALSIGPSFLF